MRKDRVMKLKEAPLCSAIFKNVRLIDPATARDEISDVVIINGILQEVMPSVEDKILRDKYPHLEIHHCDGLWLTPGFIDMHVHLREPGEEYKETISSGTKAGVAGGYIALACMPNTKPPNDNPAVTRFIIDRAKNEGYCHVHPVGAITKEIAGKELTEMGALVEAGAVGFSDDGQPVMNAQVMRRAMEYSKIFDVPIISHAEDKNLSADGVMNEGKISSLLGLRGIPKIAEEIMVARDIMLASWTKAKLHIAHVSTKGSVKLIREAKREGISVTAETAPHYFTLTEEALINYDPVFKVNPPLRTQEDVEAVIEGLVDGTIDVVATDHAPHSVIEKDVEFDNASSGMIGLETALSLLLELVFKGYLTPLEAIKKLTINPARILNLPYGRITPGEPAFVTLIDPTLEWTVKSEEFYSLSRNCPFENKRLKGVVRATIVEGRLVYTCGS